MIFIGALHISSLLHASQFTKTIESPAQQRSERKKIIAETQKKLASAVIEEISQGKLTEQRLKEYSAQDHFDINAQTDDGHSLLMEAVIRRNATVVTLLLSNMADPDLRNDKGFTALIYAALVSHYGFVNSLTHTEEGIEVYQEKNRAAVAMKKIVAALLRNHADMYATVRIAREDQIPHLADDATFKDIITPQSNPAQDVSFQCPFAASYLFNDHQVVTALKANKHYQKQMKSELLKEIDNTFSYDELRELVHRKNMQLITQNKRQRYDDEYEDGDNTVPCIPDTTNFNY